MTLSGCNSLHVMQRTPGTQQIPAIAKCHLLVPAELQALCLLNSMLTAAAQQGHIAAAGRRA